MSIIICIAQNTKELDFIVKNYNSPKLHCLPISLETYCYCKKNGINILNINYSLEINKQKELLTNVNNILETIHFDKSISLAFNNEILSAYRYTLHSSFYLIELLYLACQIDDIEKIIISGWESQTKNIFSIENYIVSALVENFARFKNLNIFKINQDRGFQNDLYNYKYFTEKRISNYILLNSPAYNFNRISLVSILFNLKNSSITFSKPTFYNSLKWKLLNHSFIYFNNLVIDKYTPTLNKHTFNISYKSINLDNILNMRRYMLSYYMHDLLAKKKAIDEFIKCNIPKSIFSFSCRGIDGYLLEKSKFINTKSILISHGTVAEFYNLFDKIYKQIIADAVFSGKASYTLLQTKIAVIAKDSLIIRSESFATGNLIFSGIKTSKKKKYFLYCVTLKDFNNLQFLGVENYYQFLENLNILNRVSVNTGEKFIIKLHPSQEKLSFDLINLYPDLIFSNKSIKKLLRYAYGLISFSSTSIEDALTSKVPVILFDLNNCYKHCNSEIDVSKLNEPIYYVNNEIDFIQSIKTIQDSNEISYNSILINSNHYFDNIFNLFISLGFKCKYPYLKKYILNFIYKLNLI